MRPAVTIPSVTGKTSYPSYASPLYLMARSLSRGKTPSARCRPTQPRQKLVTAFFLWPEVAYFFQVAVEVFDRFQAALAHPLFERFSPRGRRRAIRQRRMQLGGALPGGLSCAASRRLAFGGHACSPSSQGTAEFLTAL